jgi:hypothetical protein
MFGGMPTRYSVVVVAIIGCATPSSGDGTNVRRPSADDSHELLGTLRTRRAEVARARPEEQVDRGGDFDLKELIGLTQTDIESALGEPEECGTELPVGGKCRTNTWEYVLYHLPETSLGGGTMLVLQFDIAGRCNYARWSGRK